jgi:hypothetical protein
VEGGLLHDGCILNEDFFVGTLAIAMVTGKGKKKERKKSLTQEGI